MTIHIPRKLLAIIGAMLACVLLGAASCDSDQSQAQRDENAQQGAASGQMVKTQPVPSFPHSQLRQNLIDIETAQAQGVQSTSFFFLAGVDHPVGQCPSIGMPVPNTASLSNPEQTVWGSGGGATIGQMDPNGAYVPESSSGTYVICVSPSGKAYAKYWEGEVDSEIGPAMWDGKQIVLTGDPTFHFSGGK